MKKGYKIFSLSLIITGIVLCVIGAVWFSNSDYGAKTRGTFSETSETVKITSIVANCDFGGLKIVSGDKFSVDCKDIVKDKFSYNLDNGTLTVNYKFDNMFDKLVWSNDFGFFNFTSNDPKITVTVPDTQFESVEVSLGMGQADIENISCKKAKFDVGVGRLTALSCEFDYLNIDNGIGETSLKNCTLNGDADLDNGIGSINLQLAGNKADYALDCDNGIGEIRVNGESSVFEYSSEGKYKINADNGIGEIQINFIG